jgi:hypothetical protein
MAASHEKLSPGAEERPQLSQLRVSVVRSEKLAAEAGESSGTQRKRNVRRWKPLPSKGWRRPRKLYVCSSYNDLWSLELGQTVVVI